MTDPSAFSVSGTDRLAVSGCHIRCGHCCTDISISSPIPGMPDGKPAGIRCPHLGANRLCRLFGHGERPAICREFSPAPDFCGDSPEEARNLLREWEKNTS